MTVDRVHGSDAEALAAVGRLRADAWAPVVGAAAAVARFGVDRHDGDAWHCVLSVDGVRVAAARLTEHHDLTDLPEATSFGPHASCMRAPLGLTSRLVVHPDHQGRGFAGRLIVERLDLARDHGLREVWGETRREQLHGLVRHGYEPVGPSTDTSVPGEWVVVRAPLGDRRRL